MKFIIRTFIALTIWYLVGAFIYYDLHWAGAATKDDRIGMLMTFCVILLICQVFNGGDVDD